MTRRTAPDASPEARRALDALVEQVLARAAAERLTIDAA
jgi:hypothetical protein